MADEHFPGRYWHPLDSKGDRIQCDICPRDCKLHDDQRGLCFVRKREGDQIVLTTYGRSSGFCIDPIEKKPLNHFYPGSKVLSFGTAGCNLSCNFCQNWDISKSREFDRLCETATPEAIAETALQHDCKSVAFTYNDPVVFFEYAIDTAMACRERGIKTVAVTAGYIHQKPAEELFAEMDAVNVDLKGFNETFYHKLCTGHLQPVLDTLECLVHQTDCWTEITTLLIPGHNDSEEEIEKLSNWIADVLGDDVPLHFSAFHPDWKMKAVPPTPPETLARARIIALNAGLKYVYTGNVHDMAGGTTICPSCGSELIIRDWYEILEYNLSDDGKCDTCDHAISGQFEPFEHAFGHRRMPVRIMK